MVVVWFIAFSALLIVELLTMGLTTIWFAGGALVAALIAALDGPLWLQLVAFLAVSVVLLYFTRPIAMKYFNKTRTRTNVEGMIGKQAVVMSEIDNVQGTGRVLVNNMEWSARSANGTVINPGCIVSVKAVEGVKLIVEVSDNKASGEA